MTSRTAVAAGVLAAAALALAGCSSDSGTATVASPAAATTPGAAPGARTSPPARTTGEPGLLPAGFPMPPGTKVGRVSVEGGEVANITATLRVTDGKSVYDFWRAQLPKAGYRVTGSQLVGGIGEISFTGRDCTGPSQLGINDDSVTFECRRG